MRDSFFFLVSFSSVGNFIIFFDENLQKSFFGLATNMAAFSCGYKPSIKKANGIISS